MNNKPFSIAILLTSICAFFLAVQFADGAFETDPFEPIVLDTAIQPLDVPVNVETLDELVITPEETDHGAILAENARNHEAYQARLSAKVSGPGAARRRPASFGVPIEVPGGAVIASQEALSYRPGSTHLTRTTHLRRAPGTVGQPIRSPRHIRPVFEPIEVRVGR